MVSELRVLNELVPLRLARRYSTLYPVTGYCGGVQINLTVVRSVCSSDVIVGVATAEDIKTHHPYKHLNFYLSQLHCQFLKQH